MGVHTEIRTMARDRMRRPVTDANLEELARLREAIQDQRSEIRAHLARELGGDPEDYRAEQYLADQDR